MTAGLQRLWPEHEDNSLMAAVFISPCAAITGGS